MNVTKACGTGKFFREKTLGLYFDTKASSAVAFCVGKVSWFSKQYASGVRRLFRLREGGDKCEDCNQ